MVERAEFIDKVGINLDAYLKKCRPDMTSETRSAFSVDIAEKLLRELVHKLKIPLLTDQECFEHFSEHAADFFDQQYADWHTEHPLEDLVSTAMKNLAYSAREYGISALQNPV